MSERSVRVVDGRADHEDILNSVGIGVLTIDGSGRLLAVNDAALALFGHQRETLIGQNVKVLMPAHHASRHDGYIRHHLETGEEKIIGRGRKVEGRRADGSQFPMHLAVGRFEVDGAIRFTGIVHDLTEPERAHAAATRLGHIVEESINEIYAFDAETLRFTTVNASAAANLGYTREELQSMTPLDVKPLYDTESFARLLQPLRDGSQQRLRFETVHERKNGSRYDVEIVLHLSTAVEPPEFIAILEDVTERHRLQESLRQSQKLDAIGQLTGGIAHDFNNHLTVIAGNLELLDLELATDDADARELVAEAQSAASMSARLTKRLLSFARKSSLSPTALNLNEYVLGLSELLQRSLGEAIAIDLSLEPQLWHVNVDSSELENAVLNLAINSRDTMRGQGLLAIETANRALDAQAAKRLDLSPGDYVTLSVSDTGEGIEPDTLERIFEPFFTTRGSSGGHGLGLSMVYGFVRQSGGHIAVHSRPGDGSRFTLYFPRCETSTASPPQREIGARTGHLPSLRILVVEDDERVRRLSARRLRRLGQRVIEAVDGPSALACLHDECDIDLLFTDMVMPNGLSGLELARQLRRRRPGLPVLIVSGYSDELLALDELRREGIGLLRKPYGNDTLAEAIARVFEHASIRLTH